MNKEDNRQQFKNLILNNMLNNSEKNCRHFKVAAIFYKVEQYYFKISL